jgi:putative zinc finger/helix-turn-helix YgiT family protein
LKVEHVLESQEHTVCCDCGTSFYQTGQVERNNQRFMAFAKAIVKHIAPWEILEIREKYALSQEQANRIFQCGPTQFSKWERGEVAPTGTAALALREALDNPAFIKKLADRAGERVDIPYATESPSRVIFVFITPKQIASSDKGTTWNTSGADWRKEREASSALGCWLDATGESDRVYLNG